MNIGGKIYNKFVGLKVTEGQYQTLLRTFCKGKKDKLSQNLRNWIFEQIEEMPAIIEYSLTEERDGRAGVILYEEGRESDLLLYDSKEDAMRYVISIGAILKKEGNI